MQKKKIIVIDDDQKIRTMLERNLIYAGYEVFSAAKGIEGWELVQKEKPHLVILDIMMPEMDGYEVCQYLKQSMDVTVLMLTAKDDVKARVQGLDCGADDYLIKPFAMEELLARIRALMRRFGNDSSTVLEFADLTTDSITYQASRNGRKIELTSREFELLSYFMRHPRQVLSREKIMDAVWGFDYEGESNVLEVYIGYLRSKLEEAGEKRLIHTMRGVGYVLKE